LNKNQNYRQLGQSDLMVSPIGIGCSQFSMGKGMGRIFWPSLEEETIGAIIKTSLDGGINWFDTAESYGWGTSEGVLTEALKKAGKKPGEVIIATKWSPFFRTVSSLLKTIDKRRESLNNFTIDLYQIHWPYSFSSIKKEMKALAELVKTDKIRYAGVSNFSAQQMRTAHKELSNYGIQLVSNQVKYSLLYRKIETNGILETAQELGMSIIAYSPLALGILTGKFHDNPGLIKKRHGMRKFLPAFSNKGMEKSKPVIEILKKLAKKHDATPSQIALNWLTNVHGDTVVAIPGATKEKHAENNAGTMKFKLTKNETKQLEEISKTFKK